MESISLATGLPLIDTYVGSINKTDKLRLTEQSLKITLTMHRGGFCLLKFNKRYVKWTEKRRSDRIGSTDQTKTVFLTVAHKNQFLSKSWTNFQTVFRRTQWFFRKNPIRVPKLLHFLTNFWSLSLVGYAGY